MHEFNKIIFEKHSDIVRYFLGIVIFYVQTHLHFICLTGKSGKFRTWVVRVEDRWLSVYV